MWSSRDGVAVPNGIDKLDVFAESAADGGQSRINRIAAADVAVSVGNREAVTLFDPDVVYVQGSGEVTVFGTGVVYAFDSARVTAFGDADVRLFGQAAATLYDRSRAAAFDQSTVTLFHASRATLRDQAKGWFHDTSRGTICTIAEGELHDQAQVECFDYGTATVVSGGVTVRARSMATVKVLRDPAWPVRGVGVGEDYPAGVLQATVEAFDTVTVYLPVSYGKGVAPLFLTAGGNVTVTYEKQPEEEELLAATPGPAEGEVKYQFQAAKAFDDARESGAEDAVQSPVIAPPPQVSEPAPQTSRAQPPAPSAPIEVRRVPAGAQPAAAAPLQFAQSAAAPGSPHPGIPEFDPQAVRQTSSPFGVPPVLPVPAAAADPIESSVPVVAGDDPSVSPFGEDWNPIRG